jgi:hypothetical protein
MEVANNRQVKLLSQAFDGAPVQSEGEDSLGASVFSVHGLGGNWRLRALWTGEGWPADVEGALERLPGGIPPPDLVITARRFSPGSIELLNSRQANWADEEGNVRIRGNGLWIMRDGAKTVKRTPEFSWSPSALAVGEALLARPWPAGLSTGELASLVSWSPPQVSQVLQAFDKKGWTVKYGAQRGPSARRELSDTEGLLNAWAAEVANAERDPRLTHKALRSPLDFLLGELAEALNEEVRWALGGWVAARELAPITDAVPSLQIYVHEDDFAAPLERALRKTGLADVSEGGRVSFFVAPPSVLTLAQPGSAGQIVSAPRVYADLLALGGRGSDAGMHLKEEVLDRLAPVSSDRQLPTGLLDWEQSCRDRLDALVRDRAEVETDPYAHGTWSASYRLLGIPDPPSLRQLPSLLREAVGKETGWPAWWAPQAGDNRPRPVDGMVECWLSDMLGSNPAEADFWRADPRGRLFLLRAHQEDFEYDIEPGIAFDLVFPIWRTGECLLHAERLARRLEANSIQMMLRWTGLRGRRLSSLERPRFMPANHFGSAAEVVSYIQASSDQIRDDLSGQVRQLVDPLYTSFDFFEPPARIYEEELDAMLESTR